MSDANCPYNNSTKVTVGTKTYNYSVRSSPLLIITCVIYASVSIYPSTVIADS